jgi:hypothetical protein
MCIAGIAGRALDRGLGMHAPRRFELNLHGRAARSHAFVGVDEGLILCAPDDGIVTNHVGFVPVASERFLVGDDRPRDCDVVSMRDGQAVFRAQTTPRTGDWSVMFEGDLSALQTPGDLREWCTSVTGLWGPTDRAVSLDGPLSPRVLHEVRWGNKCFLAVQEPEGLLISQPTALRGEQRAADTVRRSSGPEPIRRLRGC